MVILLVNLIINVLFMKSKLLLLIILLLNTLNHTLQKANFLLLLEQETAVLGHLSVKFRQLF
jgi:hypothetical protein